jgi:hypothetical protein
MPFPTASPGTLIADLANQLDARLGEITPDADRSGT